MGTLAVHRETKVMQKLKRLTTKDRMDYFQNTYNNLKTRLASYDLADSQEATGKKKRGRKALP